MYIAFRPGSVMLCNKQVDFGISVIPKGTKGVVETISIDRKEGRHYTIYFDIVLMDGWKAEEDVPYILTEERIKELGIRIIQSP